MEKKKLYIVSFGDSNKYRYVYTVPENATDLDKPSPFESIEKELESYLRKEFRGQSFAFLSSAKATEINPEHAAQYADYPLLDKKALSEIEATLKNEAEDYEANSQLNDDAPFSNIPGGITT